MSTTTLDFGPGPNKEKESARGKNVATPRAKSSARALADSACSACQIITPFTVLIDTREQAPYTFTGLTSDKGQPLAVVTQAECLGHGWGDYSVRGMEPALKNKSRPYGAPGDNGGCYGVPYPIISIERKSMDDAHSTILGWGQHRDNFERELSQLNGLTFAAVVVECTEPELIANAPEYGIRTKAENAKALARSIIHWRVRFNRVQWVFCVDRRMAEIETFRLLEFFWRENCE